LLLETEAISCLQIIPGTGLSLDMASGDRYQRIVFDVAFRIVRDPGEAEEVAQAGGTGSIPVTSTNFSITCGWGFSSTRSFVTWFVT
jgi:hypothetical protein